MNTYNVDFLITAFLILALVILHFIPHKHLEDINSRTFCIFAFLGLADVVFELVSTYYIVTENYGMAATFVNTLFYMMQVLLPFTLVCYIESLRENQLLSIGRLFLWGIPTIGMLLVVLANTFTGLLFSFDSEKGYVRGSWYLLTYFFALANILVASFIVIRGRKELGSRKIKTLCEIFAITTVGIFVQLQKGALLTTGFGMSLGVLVLFFTLNNPYVHTDHMTGLYDKTYFVRQCKELIASGQKFHIIEVELYQLRHVNQVAGSRHGDYLLQIVSQKLSEICGQRAFHISGKRFVLLLNSIKEYEDCLDSLEEFFDRLHQTEDGVMEFPAVFSGIINAGRLNSGEEILDYGEYLASLAARSGPTELVQDDKQTLENFRYSKKVERYLYQAVEENLFEVYFQPIYDLKEKKFVAVEALSRLSHPELGFIPPDVFIGQAEKNGLITKITNLQIGRICEFIRDHRELMEKLRNVKINLSPMDLLAPGSGREKVNIIKAYGLPCNWFQMEITETVATQYRDCLVPAVETFEEAGIGLCLDDFGSGYANLNTVTQQPFQVIKLDRSLLFNILENEKVATFYESIVGAFKNMGYYLVAEGVEAKEEVELLGRWGVDFIQGYYYSKPLPAADLVKFMEEH